jgi:hypothetical protein
MVRRLLPAAAFGVCLAAALAGVIAVSWSTAQAITNCSTSTQALDGQEQQMLVLINQKRVEVGLLPVVASPNLSRAAAWKSFDSSASGSGFSHTDSLGRGPNLRVLQCGYAGSAGENVAYGYGGAQTTLDAWMASPGHRCLINGTKVPPSTQYPVPPDCYAPISAGMKVAGIGYNASISAWTVDMGSFDDSNQPWDSGGPAPTATPTNPTTNPSQAPSTPKAVVSSTPSPNAQLPSNVPVKRASLPMISAE